jgi:hypothetical protein
MSNRNRNPKMSPVLLSQVKHIRTRYVDRYEAYYVLTLKVNIEVSTINAFFFVSKPLS